MFFRFPHAFRLPVFDGEAGPLARAPLWRAHFLYIAVKKKVWIKKKKARTHRELFVDIHQWVTSVSGSRSCGSK